MASTNWLYGALFLLILYSAVWYSYSVYYTPGTRVLYNSPVTQALFPGSKNKLFPSWGYDKLGMYKGKPTKFGQGQFWPQSGKGFVPNKFGSGGASPSGGMRPTFDIPAETSVGFWGFTPRYENTADFDIYDRSSSEQVEYVTPIGWWGN